MNRDPSLQGGSSNPTESGRATDRLLVCVGAGSTSGATVRAGPALAASLGTSLAALHGETPAALPIMEAGQERIEEHLRLAERLGGEVVRLTGDDPVADVVRYSRDQGATIVVVGNGG